MPSFTNGWVNVAHMCRKTLEARPLSHLNPYGCLLLYFHKSTKCERGERCGRSRRGGRAHGPSQCCRAHFWAGIERSDKGQGGHSNQTPSPQAAISINHAHKALQHRVCDARWEGVAGGRHTTLVIACPTYILSKSWLSHGSLSIPPPTRTSRPPTHVSLLTDQCQGLGQVGTNI